MKELTAHEVETVSGAGFMHTVSDVFSGAVDVFINKPFHYAGESLIKPVGYTAKVALNAVTDGVGYAAGVVYKGVTGVISSISSIIK